MNASNAVALDRFDSEALLVPLSARADVYYSCVALLASRGRTAVRLQGTSVATGSGLALLKSKMELLERAAQWEWLERGGTPPAAYGWDDRGTLGDDELQAVDGSDATGFCAGTDKRKALEHGLLEVLERDAVTDVFDSGGQVSPTSSAFPPPTMEVLRAQKASASVFVYRQRSRPPTAIAVVRSTSGPGGAIGTACRGRLADAVARAIFEGVMMLTTARRLERDQRASAQFEGILWASRNIRQLEEELREKSSSDPGAFLAPASLGELAARLGATYSEFPVTTVSAPGAGVWRVQIEGAKTYAHAKREPWPIG